MELYALSGIIGLSSDDNFFLRNDYVIDKKDIDPGLETLLDLNEEVFPMENGYWRENRMRTKVVKVGIISRDDYRNRTIAIAKGTYKPKKDEPKVWFESLASMAQVLGSDNQKLLSLIIKHQPSSLAELERISSRRKSNLSRTLKTLERYGIVSLSKEKGKLVPKVKATDFKVQFGLHYSKPVSDNSQTAIEAA